MAARLDCFGLSELTAKPEDAFRLASLAMAEGTRIPGYRGDYSRMRIGDAEVIFRSMGDPATGEEELLGMDTHGATHCVWSCTVVKDLTPAEADPMSRRVLVRTTGEDRAVVDLVCPEVLPDIREGGSLRLGMTGFPLRVRYETEGECSGVVEAQEDTVLLQGTEIGRAHV